MDSVHMNSDLFEVKRVMRSLRLGRRSLICLGRNSSARLETDRRMTAQKEDCDLRMMNIARPSLMEPNFSIG